MLNKQNKLLITVGIIFILLLVGVTALLISEKQTNKELVQEFQLEKEDLENQYTDFAKQYDELKLTVYWENRVQVVLGSFSELSYKLRLCKAILEDPTRIASDARGVLDAETASSAGVFFRPSTELVCPGED